MPKKNTKKPSVKVKDLANKKDPSGGNIKFKFTTTTKDKTDTLATSTDPLKNSALTNKLITNK